jgi:hypothetical protein
MNISGEARDDETPMYIREVLFWGEETMSHASLEDTPQLL